MRRLLARARFAHCNGPAEFIIWSSLLERSSPDGPPWPLAGPYFVALPSRYLMLTHMRGKVTNMERVYQLVEEHGITVVEDCAHGLGIRWDDIQLGRQARAACFSTQSAKMINSGPPSRVTPPPAPASRPSSIPCIPRVALTHPTTRRPAMHLQSRPCFGR